MFLGPFAISLLLPFAQAPVSADRVAEAAGKFDRTSGPAMKCEFRPTVPLLDYGLHFEAGYDLKVPAGQFDGGRHEIEILLKIMPVPSSGAPLFLRDTVKLASGLAIENTGRFAIDPGSYAINSLAIDDAGRSCRARWKAYVKPLPPVHPLATGSQTTIFLNAESTTPHASALLPDDVTMLIGTLTSVMSRLAPDPRVWWSSISKPRASCCGWTNSAASIRPRRKGSFVVAIRHRGYSHPEE